MTEQTRYKSKASTYAGSFPIILGVLTPFGCDFLRDEPVANDC